MSDIFQEVEEDVRREQLFKLARRFGPYALAAVLGLILLVGGYQGYTAYHGKQQADRAAALDEATAKLAKDPKAAAQALEALSQKGGGYGLLALFREAVALEAAGDVGGAVSALDRIAAASGTDRLVADLAKLKTGYLLLDRVNEGVLQTRLAPLAAEGNPWRYEAREILAFAALKASEKAKAADAFRALVNDAGSPANLRARAANMLRSLGGTLTAPSASTIPAGTGQNGPVTGAAAPVTPPAPAKDKGE